MFLLFKFTKSKRFVYVALLLTNQTNLVFFVGVSIKSWRVILDQVTEAALNEMRPLREIETLKLNGQILVIVRWFKVPYSFFLKILL